MTTKERELQRDYQDYVRECVHYGENYADFETYAREWDWEYSEWEERVER